MVSLIDEKPFTLDRSRLDQVPTPNPTLSWTPLPHHELMNRVERKIGDYGYRITHSHCLLSHGGDRLFGSITLGRWRTRSMKGADISGSTAANWPYDQFYAFGMQDISAIGLDFSGNRYGGGMILSAKGGDFRNANFSKSPIHGCNFVGANLQGANLSGCRIWGGASFKRANLTGVNWKDATFDKSVSWPEGFDPSKVGLKLVD